MVESGGSWSDPILGGGMGYLLPERISETVSREFLKPGNRIRIAPVTSAFDFETSTERQTRRIGRSGSTCFDLPEATNGAARHAPAVLKWSSNWLHLAHADESFHIPAGPSGPSRGGQGLSTADHPVRFCCSR